MGTKHTSLRGPGVDGQSGECVAAYPHHLGAVRQEVQDPVAEGGVQPQGPDLGDELGGDYSVVINEQHSYICIHFVQVGEGSVECNRDCVICGSVGAVCVLEWVQCVWDEGVDVSHDFQSIS